MKLNIYIILALILGNYCFAQKYSKESLILKIDSLSLLKNCKNIQDWDTGGTIEKRVLFFKKSIGTVSGGWVIYTIINEKNE